MSFAEASAFSRTVASAVIENGEEDPMTETAAFTFDNAVEKVAFSADSTLLAVMSKNLLVVFRYDKSNQRLTETHRAEYEKATSFCWHTVLNEIFLTTYNAIYRIDLLQENTKTILTARDERFTTIISGILENREVLLLGNNKGQLALYLTTDDFASIHMVGSFDVKRRFWSHPQTTSLGGIDTMDLQRDALVIMLKSENEVTGVGVMCSPRFDTVQHHWPVPNGVRSIACFPDGEGFYMGRSDGTIYKASRTGYDKKLNHSIRIFTPHDVISAISFYPQQGAERFPFSYFTLAGTSKNIAFYRQSNISEKDPVLMSSYIITVGSRAEQAYNGTTGKLQDRMTGPVRGFNAFKKVDEPYPTVLHTAFSPDGKLFSYSTNDGFVGVIDFKLQTDEASQVHKNVAQTEEEQFWARLALGASTDLPGSFPRVNLT